jgi:uncharacterized membrane protein YhaH (DUF805 family)
MNLIDYAKLGVSRWSDFSGRSSRPEYWFFVLFMVILSVIASALDQWIVAPLTSFAIVSTVVGLGMLVPGVAVAVRRLHDSGRSGWFVLIALIPIVGLALIYFLVQPSDPEPNQYG